MTLILTVFSRPRPRCCLQTSRIGFPITGFTTVFLGVVWSLGTLVEQPGPLVASFIAYSLFRTFTFNYFFAFLAGTSLYKMHEMQPY